MKNDKKGNAKNSKIPQNSQNLLEILTLLHSAYPNPKTELENWQTPFQFLACVVLSAQATDKGVNKITRALFQKYETVEDFAKADLEELQTYVKSINYYKTKAKRIQDAAIFVQGNFDGELPPDIDKLTQIPGIGRKSANVILNEVLGLSQGIVVDTHVTRVSNRLGLTSYTDQKDAVKIEAELKKLVPEGEWKFYSNSAVLHGRYVCKAKSPNCKECILNKVCPSAFEV